MVSSSGRGMCFFVNPTVSPADDQLDLPGKLSGLGCGSPQDPIPEAAAGVQTAPRVAQAGRDCKKM